MSKRFPMVAVVLSAVAVVVMIAAHRSAPVTQDVAVRTLSQGERMVVLIGGSEGGFFLPARLIDDLHRAGFGVTSLSYFGHPDGPQHLREISVDRVAETLRMILDQRTCIAVVGASKGAELALILAAYEGIADASVALVPTHVVWQSSQITPIAHSSWMRAGAPLPFLPYPLFSRATLDAVFNVDAALPLHIAALEVSTQAAQAIIPVEHIRQPVLLQAAQFDQIWPSRLMAEMIVERADRLNPSHQITLSRYPFDHYLLSHAAVRRDVVAFLTEHLRECV